MKTIHTSIYRVSPKQVIKVDDYLAKEEPLEIRISFFSEKVKITRNLSVTMRTQGNDEELVTGFLFTEGIITHYNQIQSITFPAENSALAELSEEVHLKTDKLERHFYTTSSCGVCGKSSIEAIRTLSEINNPVFNTPINSSVMYSLQEKLLKNQAAFEKTGGLHASALFDENGEFLLSREDVGRHNALDKLIGYMLMHNWVSTNRILLLSGRASFELIQKAAMINIQIVAAVGAPSSLAVDLARDRSITLIGFLKENKFNIYSGSERMIASMNEITK